MSVQQDVWEKTFPKQRKHWKWGDFDWAKRVGELSSGRVESMCKGIDSGSSVLMGHPKEGQQGSGLVVEAHWGIQCLFCFSCKMSIQYSSLLGLL